LRGRTLLVKPCSPRNPPLSPTKKMYVVSRKPIRSTAAGTRPKAASASIGAPRASCT
jgi:hypothetical protein